MADNLEHLHGTEEVENAFASMLSGKPVVKKRCSCGHVLNSEKFCPECGNKNN